MPDPIPFRMSDDCIFCKIVKGEVPCSKVMDNGKVLAFLDIQPINKGHTLVIPKEHYETLLDTPDSSLKDMMSTAKKVAKSMRKTLKADGVNLGMNNFAPAGQEVMHAHIHVIPRYEADGLEHWSRNSYEEGEMDDVLKKLTMFL